MRDIKGYEGLYAITSCGRVWSYTSKSFRKPRKDKFGYLLIDLYKNGTRKCFRIHRLVAEAYIENPNNLPQVNHKNECRTDNYINNLEWCDATYNNNYGSHNERVAKSLSKKVLCVETNQIFDSITIAAKELGLDQSCISKVCLGKRKTHGKLHFKYID